MLLNTSQKQSYRVIYGTLKICHMTWLKFKKWLKVLWSHCRTHVEQQPADIDVVAAVVAARRQRSGPGRWRRTRGKGLQDTPVLMASPSHLPAPHLRSPRRCTRLLHRLVNCRILHIHSSSSLSQSSKKSIFWFREKDYECKLENKRQIWPILLSFQFGGSKK